MRGFLGIDTSNYTSSCAVYFPEENRFIQRKQLLPVEKGSMGLRQSDAVFHHTRNLPPLLSSLLYEADSEIAAVGASLAPCDSDGSYMPCFTVGMGYGRVLAAAYKAEHYEFSHQAGHISAAAWSSGKAELIKEGREFIAFHVSGGTTDVVYVTPHSEKIISMTPVFSGLDLKAGQAVDRVGGMLGLSFPSGAELEALAEKSEKDYKIKPYMRDGCPSFSGLQNKCAEMIKRGEPPCDTAKYCLDYIAAALCEMTAEAVRLYGDKPIIYAGGVMSDMLIRKKLTARFGGFFAEPLYSSDNAAGTAYLAYLKHSL